MPPIPVSDVVPTLAAANDQLVYIKWNRSLAVSEFGITILRRNASGTYDKFAFLGNSDQLLDNNFMFATYISWATNGDWVSVVSSFTGRNGGWTILMVFKVLDNGTISNIQFPDNKGRDFFSTRFLSDGSLVGVSPYAPIPYSFEGGLITFELVNDTWTVVDNFVTENAIRTTAEYTDQVTEARHPIYVLTDTHFIATDNNFMYIYTRLTNGSWELDSSFKAISGTTSISWNGDDAILTGMAFSNQFVLYQKLNDGTWDGSVVVTASDAGYTSTSQFGMSTETVNKDTFLVIAPLALDSASDLGGRVSIVQRRESQWYLAGQLLAPLIPFGPANSYSFARYNFVVTDKEVLYSIDSGLYSVPLCAFEPAEYTCQGEISLDTCDFGEFNALLVCNSTRPDCVLPNTVRTSVRRILFEDNVVTIDYTLSPFLSKSYNETVRITCGGTTGTEPTSTASPSAIPSTVEVPVTSPSTTPSVAPDRPSNVTSGSSRTIASLLLAAVVSLF